MRNLNIRPSNGIHSLCDGNNPSYAKWVWNKETGWMDTPSTAVTTLEQRYKYALSLLVEQKVY